MDCIDITNDAFEVISSELIKAERQGGSIETVCGIHEDLGLTVLLRDSARCMALVDDPTVLAQPDGGDAWPDADEPPMRPRARPGGGVAPFVLTSPPFGA